MSLLILLEALVVILLLGFVIIPAIVIIIEVWQRYMAWLRKLLKIDRPFKF